MRRRLMRRAARPGRRRHRRARGMTLIELVIAITILSIGTLAAMRALEQAQRTLGGQTERALAQQVAMNRAAELRLSGMAAGRSLPRHVEMGPVDWTVEVTQSETRGGLVEAEIRVSAPDRPGARLVAHVPPEAP